MLKSDSATRDLGVVGEQIDLLPQELKRGAAEQLPQSAVTMELRDQRLRAVRVTDMTPVRRTIILLRVSIYYGIQWAVFEPNDESLWSQLRLNIGSFMMTLFRQGAFQGSTPDKAFYVKCDGETTTQNDRNLGIVNIEVGFAPLKPAEFVIIKIQQIAGDLT